MAGFAFCFLMYAPVFAQDEDSTDTIRLAGADVERILREYWRTPRVEAELEKYRTSEEFRAKQRELETLEREFADRRFAFFLRSRRSSEIREKREELEALAEIEAARARRREREAMGELFADIQRSAEAVGRREEIMFVFDINTPHILFINKDNEFDDLTGLIIEDLNF
jgi:Skp family chaperone for outer membrane proteins